MRSTDEEIFRDTLALVGFDFMIFAFITFEEVFFVTELGKEMGTQTETVSLSSFITFSSSDSVSPIIGTIVNASIEHEVSDITISDDVDGVVIATATATVTVSFNSFDRLSGLFVCDISFDGVRPKISRAKKLRDN